MNFKNIPNILSYCRIILSFIFGWAFYEMIKTNQYLYIILSLIIFIVVIFTDYLDGVIARKTNNSTNYGALLDVTADMLFVLISYLVLCIESNLTFFFILVIIIKFIEFLITSIRYNESKNSLVFDFIGKNISKLWIGFPGIISLLYLFKINNIIYLINVFVLVTSILALISTIKRIHDLKS